MSDLRAAAQAVIEQLKHGWVSESDPVANDLRAALAQEEQEYASIPGTNVRVRLIDPRGLLGEPIV